MLSAIPRYGARVLPDTEQRIAVLERDGQLVEGPHLVAFEQAFAQYLHAPHALATAYGRTAFLHLLRAFDLPRGSEIVFPALTFWVMPAIARAAGLEPVFADVDPDTFTLDPRSLRRVLTSKTRAVVPTHLWGLPCEMEAIGRIAWDHGLTVIEDCAHALGATYGARPVGTFGDAAIFSFQMLKPLNTYGGGMAVTRHVHVAEHVAAQLALLAKPSPRRVRQRLFRGRVQRIAIRPRVFTWTLFPLLWASSWIGRRPDVYLWEPIRSLDPMPNDYFERYSNAQAALGLAALQQLAAWTTTGRAHARYFDRALAHQPRLSVPPRPSGSEHVFYQYCIYTDDRDRVVRGAIRCGVDCETLHVDLCTRLALFADCRQDRTPGAERASQAIQVPVYASLTQAEAQRVAEVLVNVACAHDDHAVRRPGAHWPKH